MALVWEERSELHFFFHSDPKMSLFVWLMSLASAEEEKDVNF